MAETISYSERANQGQGGWTTFYSWVPDWMCKLNNRLFTIKDGQLWKHHDQDNPLRNNFYGVHYPSKIVTVFNDSNSEDKIFKTLALESNKAWGAKVRTNYTESTVKASEFNQRESRFFAYIRKNENPNDLRGHTAQGVGVISSIAGLSITFAMMPNLINVGDELYQVNAGVQELIGIIDDIDMNTLTVDSIITTPVVGYFCFAKKNARIEGGEVRGKFMEVTLENNDTDYVEILAVNTNAVKSFV
jgi:hypothetical protein